MNESTSSPQPTAATHNPDGLPANKLPAGYRFLNTSEIVEPKEEVTSRPIEEIGRWSTERQKWNFGWWANDTTATYCTTLTPEELKARRAQK